MIRHFIDKSFDEQLIITSNDECFHHLNDVMKIDIAEQVAFVNRECYVYELVSNDSNQLVFNKIKQEEFDPELSCNITMFVPFLKKNNFELVLQKCSELGAYSFIAANMQNNVSKVEDKAFLKKAKRYEEIIKSAAMQSQRNYIPNISGISKIKDIQYNDFDLIICCYETRREDLLINFKKEINHAKNILIICGPEGGISKSEIETLKTFPNIIFVNLGSRILRAETAMISSCTLVAQIIEEAK